MDEFWYRPHLRTSATLITDNQTGAHAHTHKHTKPQAYTYEPVIRVQGSVYNASSGISRIYEAGM